MLKSFSLAIVLSIVASISVSAANWRVDLAKLMSSASISEQDSLIRVIADDNPDWQQLRDALLTLPFPPAETGKFILGKILCIDNVERPWVIYVPPSYNPATPTPMMVVLHGGVSSPQIIDDPVTWAGKTPFAALAEKEGWLMLFPFGQAGATWWDEVGMSNILNQVRVAKTKYNIDDNRVFLGGFSDGGSAAYLFAMALPGDFAAFVALNGNMGVGSQDGGLPTYATNFINSPIYAVNTDKDPLYPAAEAQRFIDMAKSAGANIVFRQLDGDHSLSYAETEFPLIADWLKNQIRDPFPSKIVWESSLPGLGVCNWFAIDEITDNDPATWYHDYNATYIDSSIAIGIVSDENLAGPGVKVAKLADGNYLAARIGLREGDIIVKAGNIAIMSLNDLGRFKKTLRRGDSATLTIKRDDSELILRGRMPPNKNYFLFKREQPSAEARVSNSANRVEVEASRLGAFKIFVSPQMFDLDKNIIVVVDGKEVFNARVKPDIAYLLRDFMQNRDRQVLYVNEISIKL
jgi:predicted esterase